MKSGTSQACAHVSGLVAYLLRTKGLMSPKEMKQLIIDLSLKDRLSDIRKFSPRIWQQDATPKDIPCSIGI